MKDCSVQNRGNNSGHPVLFIPGHWGYYEQARSLGAHGTGMTRQHEAVTGSLMYSRYLDDATRMSREKSGDEFLYDVFVVDFNSEASAIHASFMHNQAVFANRAIQTILSTCSVESVTLVGHSFGGVIARAVPVVAVEDYVPGSIRTIISLGSPHVGLPYSFDRSVDDFYQQVNKYWKINDVDNNVKDISVVSLSGGLRDELIRQDLTNMDSLHEHSISVSVQ